MPTFIMLTARADREVTARPVDERAIGREARKAKWWMRYPADAGAWCSVDIFEAPTLAAALLISTRISEISSCRTELWPVATSVEMPAPAPCTQEKHAYAFAALSVRRLVRALRAWTGKLARPTLHPGLEAVGETK